MTMYTFNFTYAMTPEELATTLCNYYPEVSSMNTNALAYDALAYSAEDYWEAAIKKAVDYWGRPAPDSSELSIMASRFAAANRVAYAHYPGPGVTGSMDKYGASKVREVVADVLRLFYYDVGVAPKVREKEPCDKKHLSMDTTIGITKDECERLISVALEAYEESQGEMCKEGKLAGIRALCEAMGYERPKRIFVSNVEMEMHVKYVDEYGDKVDTETFSDSISADDPEEDDLLEMASDTFDNMNQDARRTLRNLSK